MGNLITSIPVYKPQMPVSSPVKKPSVLESAPTTAPVKNTVAQYQAFSYLPAEPLSPALTAPKGVKPIKPAGHLVKENIFQSAGSTIKSYADYVKYFYKAAFKGEGTDYSVGKINDLAIRTGSLGIAAVLASSKMFPFAKGMEFVGLATWFASMAIWPRIIGAPIKMGTGVDINQKYIDSYDRRKNFFEDPQYLPWDLYRHIDKKGKHNENAPEYEKLEAIGDKLGIPRDIPNRREAIQDKMKQIAIQGNSLWMLTAGVMTPVISSIVADSLQEPMKNGLEKFRILKESKNIAKLNEGLDSLLSETSTLADVMKTLDIKPDANVKAEFESLLGGEKNVLTKEGFGKLEAFLSDRYFAKGILKPIQEEMKFAMDASEPIIEISDKLQNDLRQITADSIQEAMALVPEANKSKVPQKFTEYKGLQLHEISAALNESMVQFGQKEAGLVQRGSIKNLLARKVIWTVNEEQNVDRSLLKALREIINKNADKYFEEVSYHKIDTGRMKHIFNFAETHLNLTQQVEKYEKATVMNISESVTAINWDRVPKNYLKSLGFSKAELAEIGGTDSKNASKLVLKKFEELAKSPEQFEKVLGKMTKLAAEAVTKEEKAVLELIGTYDKPGVLTKVKDIMTRIANQDNFSDEAKAALSREYNGKIRDIYQKLVNTIDSFGRQIKGIDTIKNIDNTVGNILGKNVDEFKGSLNDIRKFYTFAKMPPSGLNEQQLNAFYESEYQRAKTGLSTFIKDIVINKNDINDWTTKMEHNVPGYKKGIKHSKELLWKIADVVNGPIGEPTAKVIIDSAKNDVEKVAALNFIDKLNKNTEEMKFRFMATENKLLEHSNERNIKFDLVDDFFNKNDFSKFAEIEDRLKRRVHEITKETAKANMDNVIAYKTAVLENTHYNKTNPIKDLKAALCYSVSNATVASESGKNVTDFIKQAAENQRSRNKWTKLAYGLLIGTTAFTALALAFVGRKNYFNKDEYKNFKKDTAPEGVNK